MNEKQAERSTTELYLTGLAEKLTLAVFNLQKQCELLKLELDEQRDFMRSMKENAPDHDRLLTVREAAKVAGVSYETMLGWANWMEIEAVNVAKKKCGRPRWRIAPEALQSFLRSRARLRHQPPRRRRRAPKTEKRKEYF